jgi:hypothetical protein
MREGGANASIEDIGRLSSLKQDSQRPMAKHILATLIGGAVRGMACGSIVDASSCANVRYAAVWIIAKA